MMLYTEARLVRHARKQAISPDRLKDGRGFVISGSCDAMLSWFRRVVMSPVEEIDQELRKLAKELRDEADTARCLVLLEDANDLLDRRLSATKGV